MLYVLPSKSLFRAILNTGGAICIIGTGNNALYAEVENASDVVELLNSWDGKSGYVTARLHCNGKVAIIATTKRNSKTGQITWVPEINDPVTTNHTVKNPQIAGDMRIFTMVNAKLAAMNHFILVEKAATDEFALPAHCAKCGKISHTQGECKTPTMKQMRSRFMYSVAIIAGAKQNKVNTSVVREAKRIVTEYGPLMVQS